MPTEAFKPPKHPPVVEMHSGDDDSIERQRTFEEQRALRDKLLTETAIKLLTTRGELLGVVDKKDKEGRPYKAVVDLSDADLGTEVFLDNPNPYARSHRLNLPKTIDGLTVTSNELPKTPPATERRGGHDDEDFSEIDWMDRGSQGSTWSSDAAGSRLRDRRDQLRRDNLPRSKNPNGGGVIGFTDDSQWY